MRGFLVRLLVGWGAFQYLIRTHTVRQSSHRLTQFSKAAVASRSCSEYVAREK